MVFVIGSRGVGTHTDAEIWLLTESLIELLAYKVKTHTERPHFESSQLSVDESDKVNDLLAVCLTKLRRAASIHTSLWTGTCRCKREGGEQRLHSARVSS